MKKDRLKIVVNGCSGMCCAAFYFPYTPEELRRKEADPNRPNTVDGPQIAEMLIPLTNREATERLRAFGSDNVYEDEATEGKIYTCKNFDEENRLCTIYESRPEMCAGYPYGRPCQFAEGPQGCGIKTPELSPALRGGDFDLPENSEKNFGNPEREE